MRYFELALIIIGICFIVFCCFFSPGFMYKTQSSQQLIDAQAETIKFQGKEIEELTIECKEIFKISLKVASENNVLNKLIEDMTVSMKQMFEYMESLEEKLQDRET